jgi:CIC family chloride channel protein
MDPQAVRDNPPARPFRWFPEFLTLTRTRVRSQARLLGAAVLVGVVAGLGAIVFMLACQIVVYFALNWGAGYHPAAPANEHPPSWLPEFQSDLQPWLLLLIPTIGGLISGVLVFTTAPEAEGHGTDAVIAAYHNPKGRIRYRVPIVKTIASALTIGSGGSGGREGPIAQIGAGFGVFLADVLRLRPAERRVLMAAGMGAGIAAIFRAPLAGALFAAEVMYFSPEFEPEVIMPAGLASVVSYCTFGLFFHDGWKPLFDTPNLTFDNPWQLGPYLLLALVMIALAMLYTRSFYGLTGLFHRLRMPRHFKPALGAFLTGAVGLALYFGFDFVGYANKFVLSVLAFGYGSLQGAMDGSIEKGMGGQALAAAAVLLAIALGKILTTGLTIGSGGSGGVFGPSMVIGGCAGGALGLLLKVGLTQMGFPEAAPPAAACVLVGMAGFFAAAAKTPFSTMIIVSEMTGNYNLLLPALFVCTVAFLFSDRQSLYRNQVVGRALSPAHQGSWVREVMAGLQVRQFLTPDWRGPALKPDDPAEGVSDRFDAAAGDILPVVDGERRLLGIVSLEEVHLADQAEHARPLLLAADLMRIDVRPLKPEDGLDRAMELFAENDLLALPVVGLDRRVVGVVRRSDVAGAYLRRLHAPRAPLDVAAGAPPDSRVLLLARERGPEGGKEE